MQKAKLLLGFFCLSILSYSNKMTFDTNNKETIKMQILNQLQGIGEVGDLDVNDPEIDKVLPNGKKLRTYLVREVRVPINLKKSASDLVDVARSFLGIRYTWGGNTRESGLDCSAFVRSVYQAFGVHLPRVSRDQARVGVSVAYNDMRVGDLLFFKTNKANPDIVSHVGIYIGNNKMIHASSSYKQVIEVDLSDSYFQNRLSNIQRIF